MKLYSGHEKKGFGVGAFNTQGPQLIGVFHHVPAKLVDQVIYDGVVLELSVFRVGLVA